MADYSNRKILTLYTGGTIGMKESSTGLKPGSLDDMLKKIPGVNSLPYQIYFQDFFNKNGKPIDSSDANLELFNLLAKKIEEEVKNYDGFVIIYGTDTMGPAAGYLSYMLEGINKPVVFTGAMEPVIFSNSDGPRNLIDAINLAGRSGIDIPVLNEVMVAFGGRIIRGNSAFKYSSKEHDAFRTQGDPLGLDYPDLGSINGNDINIVTEKLIPELSKNRELKINIIPDTSIGTITINPFLQEEQLINELNVYKNCDAIVLSGLPIYTDSEYEKNILENTRKDIPIFYICEGKTPSHRFLKLEGISDYQQALAKITYLLSRTRNQELLREMSSGNLRGENNNDLTNETELLKGSEINKELNIRLK